MTQLIQIVPTLPPLIGGVGDYAHCLAMQLAQDCHLKTHFLVSDPSWLSNGQEIPYTVSPLSQHQSLLIQQLDNGLDSGSTVLIHYVSYGYSKQGTPTWLIDGLNHWKTKHPKGQLVTMFHEIAASGPIWSRAFWRSGMQKRLAKRLIEISDRILTSKQLYAEILQRYAQGRFSEIPALPVFSNVGEPSNLSDLSTRQRHLVVFGGRGRRAKVYQSSLDQLDRICHCLDIQQIFDIGPKLDSIPSHVGDVPITPTGSLPSDEVSAILSGAIAGFFNYHPAFLGKSTIFAAYCAHRMLPVSAQMTSHIEDGLYPGQHYILSDQYSADMKNEILLQSIADKAYAWYQSHNLSAQAKTYQALLSNF
ncbi:MAG: glycosyltransferase family 1 protein [Cyanothece sp. SIO2G6]|nr:glycosyltransferase family 1 protein [Cyanothece sp. SIO2G6]